MLIARGQITITADDVSFPIIQYALGDSPLVPPNEVVTLSDGSTITGSLGRTIYVESPIWSDSVPADPKGKYVWMRTGTVLPPETTPRSWVYSRVSSPSVKLQYSTDGINNWHDTFSTGDLFARNSTDGGQTWSSSYRIVGESGAAGSNGKYVNYQYTSGSATAPEGTWQDAPPTINKGKCLWCRTRWEQVVNGSVTALTNWVEIRIGGVDGNSGTNIFITYHSNPLSTPPTKPTGNGTTLGWDRTPTASSVWMSTKESITIDTGTWSDPMPIRGSDGRLPRTCGYWNNTTVYVNSGSFRDVVLYNNQFYLVADNRSSVPAGTLPTNTSYWTVMNNFQPIATQLILADSGFINILGAQAIYLGSDPTNRWEITANGFRHTKLGTQLTSDGHIIAPPGGIIFSNGSTVEDTIRDQVDGISVGSRNLLLDSKYINVPSSDEPYNFKALIVSKNIHVGQFNFSADVVSSIGITSFQVLFFDEDVVNSGGASTIAIVNGKAIGYVDCLEVDKSRNLLFYAGYIGQTQGKSLELKNIMLSSGNKSTDWTPAPEDFENKIEEIQVGGRNLFLNTNREFTGENRDVPTSVDLTKYMGKYLSISCDLFAEGVTEAGRIGAEVFFEHTDGESYGVSIWKSLAIGESFNGRLKESKLIKDKPIKLIQYKGAFVQLKATKAHLIRLKLEEGNRPTDWTPAPEDLTSGGVNLIRGTKMKTPLNYWSHSGLSGYPATYPYYDDSQQAMVFQARDGWNTHTCPIKVTGACCVSFEFKLKTHSGTPVDCAVTYGPGYSDRVKWFLPTTEWQTFKVCTEWNTSKFGIALYHPDNNQALYEIYVRNLKVERGTTFSDWTPAPDDTIDAIDNVTIGGTNLIRNTASQPIPGYWLHGGTTKNDAPYFDGFAKALIFSTKGGESSWTCAAFDAQLFGECIISFEAKTHATPVTTVDNGFWLTLGASPSDDRTLIPLERYWKKFSFKAKWDFYRFGFALRYTSVDTYKVAVRNLKVERGNKPTSWSACPSDYASNTIGGKNLLLDSRNARTSSTYLITRYKLTEKWIPGQEYTLTFKGSINDKGSFGVWRDNGGVCAVYNVPTDGKGNFRTTFVCPEASPDDIDKDVISFYNVPSETALTSTIYEVKLELGGTATEWSPSMEEYEYLKNAIENGKTTINGGLILTNILQLLGSNGSVTAGVNGLNNSPNSPAFWAGGTFQQAMDRSSAFGVTHGGPDTQATAWLKGVINAFSGTFGYATSGGFRIQEETIVGESMENGVAVPRINISVNKLPALEDLMQANNVVTYDPTYDKLHNNFEEFHPFFGDIPDHNYSDPWNFRAKTYTANTVTPSFTLTAFCTVEIFIVSEDNGCVSTLEVLNGSTFNALRTVTGPGNKYFSLPAGTYRVRSTASVSYQSNHFNWYLQQASGGASTPDGILNWQQAANSNPPYDVVYVPMTLGVSVRTKVVRSYQGLQCTYIASDGFCSYWAPDMYFYFCKTKGFKVKVQTYEIGKLL